MDVFDATEIAYKRGYDAGKQDYDDIIHKLDGLLAHVTGSRLSKSTYDLNTMITNADDYLNELIEEAVQEVKVERIIHPIVEELNFDPNKHYIVKISTDGLSRAEFEEYATQLRNLLIQEYPNCRNNIIFVSTPPNIVIEESSDENNS